MTRNHAVYVLLALSTIGFYIASYAALSLNGFYSIDRSHSSPDGSTTIIDSIAWSPGYWKIDDINMARYINYAYYPLVKLDRVFWHTSDLSNFDKFKTVLDPL